MDGDRVAVVNSLHLGEHFMWCGREVVLRGVDLSTKRRESSRHRWLLVEEVETGDSHKLGYLHNEMVSLP